MKIRHINGYSPKQVLREADQGARFVQFSYTISLLVVTLKRTSDVYMIRSHEKASIKGLRFTIISFLFGWWGIPSGPINTIRSISTNLRGGQDVTGEVTDTFAGQVLFMEAQQRKKMQLS